MSSNINSAKTLEAAVPPVVGADPPQFSLQGGIPGSPAKAVNERAQIMSAEAASFFIGLSPNV